MKYFILLLSLSFLNCYSQAKDCSNFRIGTFRHIDSIDDTIITRNDSIQIELDSKTGTKYTGTIEWLSNCQYSLTYTDVNNKDRKHIIGTKFYIDIIFITDSTYKYFAYNNKLKIKGELVKIK